MSFFITAIVFRYFGLNVNTMTLGGLAIAIGELVDDSIVDVENILRRLRENSQSENPRAPLGIAYLTALTASLVVSLTLTPVLSSCFMSGNFSHHDDTKLVFYLKKMYQKSLEWALPRSGFVFIIAIIMLLVSAVLVSFMGRDFLPAFNEGTVMINITAPAGTSLTRSNQIGERAEALMLSIPEVKSVSRRTGRAELDEHAVGVNESDIYVDFHSSGRDRETVINEIRKQLKAEFPELGINVGQPMSHIIEHMLTEVNAALAIKIFGPDLTILRAKAIELEAAIQGDRRSG
jgi:Cu(I)/Ag(I) efflux system membrane protein CusA/SilA